MTPREARQVEDRRTEKALSKASDAEKTVLQQENGAFAFPRHLIVIDYSGRRF